MPHVDIDQMWIWLDNQISGTSDVFLCCWIWISGWIIQSDIWQPRDTSDFETFYFSWTYINLKKVFRYSFYMQVSAIYLCQNIDTRAKQF